MPNYENLMPLLYFLSNQRYKFCLKSRRSGSVKKSDNPSRRDATTETTSSLIAGSKRLRPSELG